MYVRSLCRWAVAANARLSFWLARCARGGYVCAVCRRIFEEHVLSA